MKTLGYIYCLSNEMYNGVYKIGFTKKNPILRKQQLFTTGVPFKFKLEFAKKVNDYKDKEKYLHDILSLKGSRINKKREFFKEDLEEIKKLFDEIDGEWFINNKHEDESTHNDDDKKDIP